MSGDPVIRPWDDEYRGLTPSQGVLTAADVLGGLAASGVIEYQASAMAGTAALRRSQAVKELARARAVNPAHVARDAWYGRLDAAQELRDDATGFLASMAAGAGTGAVIGSFVPVPGVGTVAGAVVGAAVGVFTSGVIDSLFEEGPDVGAALDRGTEALADTGQAIADAPGALAGAVGGWFD